MGSEPFMSTTGGGVLSNWADKFDHPTKKLLLSDLSQEQATLFEKAYKSLAGACESKPKLVWMDLPWNWCFVFQCPKRGLVESVYLVPDPETPRIATTIRKVFFEKHPLDTLPSTLQSGISSGVLINHQSWCQWELPSSEVLNDITELISLAASS
jgi:hypothetical protein